MLLWMCGWGVISIGINYFVFQFPAAPYRKSLEDEVATVRSIVPLADLQ